MLRVMGSLKMASKTQRVVFSFAPRSLEKLKQLAAETDCSMAEAVRETLQVRRALHQQARKGFTEIVTRKPGTSEERILVMPLR